eukprot:112920-Chlamydomonas_euryale.AAC.1
MDGGMLDDYKEDAPAEDASAVDFKQLVGHNWVDPPERKRKRLNYNENDYFRSASGLPLKPLKDKAKGPKMPAMTDFQFYDAERLRALFHKAYTHEQLMAQKLQKARMLERQGAKMAIIEEAMQLGPGEPEPLSADEEAEKERLLSEGFGGWTRRDYSAFLRGCEKCGRRDLAGVAAE